MEPSEVRVIGGERVDIYKKGDNCWWSMFTESVFNELTNRYYNLDKYDVMLIGCTDNLRNLFSWLPTYRQFFVKDEVWDDFAQYRVLSAEGIAIKLRFDNDFSEDEIGVIARDRKKKITTGLEYTLQNLSERVNE